MLVSDWWKGGRVTYMLETGENAALATVSKSHTFISGIGRFKHNFDSKETLTSTFASFVHSPISATPKGGKKLISHLVEYIIRRHSLCI